MSRIARRTPKIKTISQLVGGRAKKTERHVHQFQIACLELERTRRMKELGIAMDRVTSLNTRLAAIESEMEQHRQQMPPLPGEMPTIAATPQALPNVAKAPVPRAEGPRGGSPAVVGQRRTLRY